MKEKPQCPCPRRPGQGNKAVQSQAVGEMTGTPHPNAGRGDAGSGWEPSHPLQGPTPSPLLSSNTSGKEQDAVGPSPSPLAPRSRRSFGSGGNGEGRGCAGPALGRAAPAPPAALSTRSVAPPRLGSPRARARAAPTKGAARAAREDGARGATAPPALATGQAQRHLSAFQPHPTPPPPPRKIPHSGRLGGREPHWGRALSAKISATRVSLLFGQMHGPRRRRPAGRRVLRPPRGLVRARPQFLGGASGSGGEAAGQGPSRRQARAENRAGAGG